MTRNIVVLLWFCAAVAAPRAEAQNPQPAPPGVTPTPMAPPNAPSPPPEQIAPAERDAHAGSKQTLSDRLALQHGTVEPPHDVDPGMTVSPPAQAQGTMPIIPPPGSPGGDQQVVPK
ncbi:MAG: hypothetical protein ABSC95_24960 [Acetobacteraceae bacterium]|jgi:hypothetical protein